MSFALEKQLLTTVILSIFIGPNQTYRTKPAKPNLPGLVPVKSNLPNQTKPSKPNLANQT